jgi:hypothetical protein
VGQYTDETEDDPCGKQAGLAADVEPGDQFHVVEPHDLSLFCDPAEQIVTSVPLLWEMQSWEKPYSN